ncbi:MAG: leucyl/phenylalanyl-tRNA--protein transferase [Psychrobium sp.]
MSQLTLLDPTSIEFPPVHFALSEPDGLLAVGGDLTDARLINAYQNGIFPWFNEDDPIMWWSPSQRCVIDCHEFHVSRSLAKFIRKTPLRVTINHAFEDVIHQCRQPRKDGLGTWIDNKMTYAYIELHRQGNAQSIEVWENDKLIGGLYGVSMSNVFCGESMFSIKPNGSKIALLALSKFLLAHNISLIDCQIENPHLISLGAKLIERDEFITYISKQAPSTINWQPQELPFV